MTIILRKALTLFEAMIVVVIIAIILAIAIPDDLKSGKTSQKTVRITNLERTKGINYISAWF